MKPKEIHSEEVQEILDRPPTGLARWGTLAVWIMFLAFLGAALFIKYPEIISVPVKIMQADSLSSAINNRYTVYTEVSSDNSEKIRKGQQVLLKINEYPYQKFGMIRAEVADISNQSEEVYLVKLKLLNGLETTHNITLTTNLSLSGIADITTSKQSILARLLDNL